MDTFKNLPFDLQKTIYDDYLEKQREYHIERFEKLNKDEIWFQRKFNDMIGTILNGNYYHNLLSNKDWTYNAIKDGEVIPFNLIEEIKEYESIMKIRSDKIKLNHYYGNVL